MYFNRERLFDIHGFLGEVVLKLDEEIAPVVSVYVDKQGEAMIQFNRELDHDEVMQVLWDLCPRDSYLDETEDVSRYIVYDQAGHTGVASPDGIDYRNYGLW